MLCTLTASEAAARIKRGEIESRALVEACLQRIDETDGQLKAWAHIDKDGALAQADASDARRRHGRAMGVLDGVPVGLKDIIDTAGQPTERGSSIHAGRIPDQDAAVVEKLREAGAVVLGKTVTTEFAGQEPAETGNPHSDAHGPGGSSSGSAAAVAAGQVPLALGSQTNGSVIRPASFCGVYGFKPTHGMISRRGLLETSATLDQLGVFSRSLEDAALLTDALTGFDRADSQSLTEPKPSVVAGLSEDPPMEPIFAWMELPHYKRLDDATRDGLEELRTLLGDRIETVEAPRSIAALVADHNAVQTYEIARNLAPQAEAHWDKMSPRLREGIEAGRAVSAARYDEARSALVAASDYFDAFFMDYDAVISPSAAGEAPKRGEGTGDPIFCTVWTACGLPCVTMPLLAGENGLPVGAQLVGQARFDGRLFRTARWLEKELAGTADPVLEDA